MKNTGLQYIFVAIGLALLASSCTSSPPANGIESGGTSGSGGAARAGGTPGSGGSVGTGGGSASGGATASGGLDSGGSSSGGESNPGSGGSGSGGASTSGGTSSAGGTATGGLASLGGVTATGGTRSTGGATGLGGDLGPGGTSGVGASTATGGNTGAGGSPHTGTWQIMPLGDSITGTTCFPKLLAKELIDKGHTNFTFVGTVLNNQDCGTGVANVQTEGHGGFLVTYLTTDSPPQSGMGNLSGLKSWAAEKPDIVLMEYGTNDVWNSIAPATITSAYSVVVDQFRYQNPNVIFFVAQITAMNPSDGSCTQCESRVEALNAQIPAWASGKSTTASPIYVVNVWSAFTTSAISANTKDGVHPNTVGSQHMADVWYAGMVAQGLP